ncbi:MAG TPA: flagellar hook-basal body complex protein FliE [Rhizomicrobium sp.]|jgi:flagellar hook-basal body complex protein FliE|nr:flagellar hook-basal body complex protein FliE [Rhizomicrobium sp.]
MMQVLSIAPAAALPVTNPLLPTASPARSFSNLLVQGIENVSQKQVAAEDMVRAFVLDDKVPVHEVTYALEQARLSLEMMLQVRSRLLEGYQQLMNMQL